MLLQEAVNTTKHGPYRRPEGSVAGFNRFAHSAGPGIVGKKVEWILDSWDGGSREETRQKREERRKIESRG